MSEIVVECYKRLVLCSLIARDELSRFPRHTASVVQRNLKSACSEYIALADAYKTRNGDVLSRPRRPSTAGSGRGTVWRAW